MVDMTPGGASRSVAVCAVSIAVPWSRLMEPISQATEIPPAGPSTPLRSAQDAGSATRAGACAPLVGPAEGRGSADAPPRSDAGRGGLCEGPATFADGILWRPRRGTLGAQAPARGDLGRHLSTIISPNLRGMQIPPRPAHARVARVVGAASASRGRWPDVYRAPAVPPIAIPRRLL
jgi:hypothetical protein